MSNAGYILVALLAGLLLGVIGGTHAADHSALLLPAVDTIGALWLNSLRMTVVPLVVSLLITGIAQTARAARAGRLAVLSLSWIVAVMALSGLVGAFMTPLLLHLWPLPAEAAAALKSALGAAPPVAAPPPFAEFVKSIVPVNPFAAAVNDAILPLIIFTGAFGFALTRLPEGPRDHLASIFSALADAMIIIIGWVLKIAPIGVFALAFGVGVRSGGAAFGALLHYVLILSSIGIAISLSAYAVGAIGGRIRLRDYARQVAPVQALAISTQSSLACLPIMLRKSQELGVHSSTADVVLPMAVALMRATGPAMNFAVALYVANLFGMTLVPSQIAIGVVICVLTSMSSVSLPGQVSFVTAIAPICLALGIPVAPLALLLAVETLPDIARTLGNAMMDLSVTCAIGRRDGIEEAA